MQVLSERQAALVAAAEAEAETAKPDCPLQRAKSFQQIGSGNHQQQLLQGPVILPPWAKHNPLDSHLTSSSSTSASNSPIAAEVERFWAMHKKEEAYLAAEEETKEACQNRHHHQQRQMMEAAAQVAADVEDEIAVGVHTCWFFDQAAELCAPSLREEASWPETAAADLLCSEPSAAIDAGINAPWWATRV